MADRRRKVPRIGHLVGFVHLLAWASIAVFILFQVGWIFVSARWLKSVWLILGNAAMGTYLALLWTFVAITLAQHVEEWIRENSPWEDK
ncbi:hypothetical protein HY416_02990 [Candidatus Kaiserbacteria bacterium]|nr:hypothetical protein [Candidatus Kaiserbacteria bacterium]